MPRNRNAKRGKRPSSKAQSIELQVASEPETDQDESFKTPATDENVTDYRLDYSSASLRNMPPPARTPQRTRSANISSVNTWDNRSSDSRSPVGGPSTSHQQQRRPERHTGSARRKSKLPKKKNHVYKIIKRLQRSTTLLIPRLPFARLIREILMNYAFDDIRITPTALEALQESTEIYLTSLLSDSYRCTLHRDRVTLQVKDVELARYLRGRNDPGNA